MKFHMLKKLREAANVSQEAVANFIGVTQTTYFKYEHGKINLPVDILIRLADFYNTSTDFILGRTGKK